MKMGEMRDAYNIFGRERPLGKPRHRWRIL
jgi:hypothetical protein